MLQHWTAGMSQSICESSVRSNVCRMLECCQLNAESMTAQLPCYHALAMSCWQARSTAGMSLSVLRWMKGLA
jgi:hypothetical protein